MGEGLLAVLAICATAIIVTGILVWMKVSLAAVKAPRPVEPPAEPKMQRSHVGLTPWVDAPQYRSEFKRAPEKPVAAPKDEDLPHPVDPDHVPYVVRYKAEGNTPPPKCHCHGIPLVPGQRVLFWPVLGSHGKEFWIYCANKKEASK